MSTITSEVDREACTLTFVAEAPAAPDRVWQIWEDPRELERWWGPPSWPATFVTHELVAGGRSGYYLTGPAGERSHSWWSIESTDPPRGFSFDEGFADADGQPDGTLPAARVTVTLLPIGANETRLTVVKRFASAEALERLLEMGMRERMGEAMHQIHAVLETGGRMAMRLELIPLRSTDVERSKRFYVDQVGFTLDHDVEPGNGLRIVQLTPPGSSCSVVVGIGLGDPSSAPVQGIHLVVDDVDRARASLRQAGVEVSEVTDMGGGIRYAYFSDPDGNSWALQQIDR